MIKTALIQTNTTIDIEKNIAALCTFIKRASAGGAKLVLTPEASNFLGGNDRQKFINLKNQKEDRCLFELRNLASSMGIWLIIGSLILKSEFKKLNNAPFLNRSFLINPYGKIVAHYDKINMFDIRLNTNEFFQESTSFTPGNQSILIKLLNAKIGLTRRICCR